jgi:hypothetical protein
MVAGNICQVEGCTNVLKKTDGRICQMHRNRMFRHGTYDISPNWRNLQKGTLCISPLGYVRVNIDGKRVLYHRYVMEQFLGRKLTRSERIHHINGNKTDNRIENLELFSNNGQHMKKHHPDGWKRRKTRGEVPPIIIHSIVDRISLDGGTFSVCFCGAPVMCRNLCSKHYQWAYTHKIFIPNQNQSHYDKIHHSSSSSDRS